MGEKPQTFVLNFLILLSRGCFLSHETSVAATKRCMWASHTIVASFFALFTDYFEANHLQLISTG